MDAITPVSQAEQALFLAKTPEESKKAEILAAAAKAWAKEQGDYELIVESAHIYILARRKTTELCKPYAPDWGGDRRSNEFQDDQLVILKLDFGFTPEQWYKRNKELEIPIETVEEYFDDCIVKNVIPTLHGLLRFNNPHITFTAGDVEWNTPAQYIEAARRVMGEIDLDPASNDSANKIVKAKQYYTVIDDGLNKEWRGRVWMNPPFATELIGKFCAKLADHFSKGDVTEAIVLGNNATETAWFASLVSVGCAVVFPRNRIKFWKPDGMIAAPLQGQAIIYMGNNPEAFFKEFLPFGWGGEIRNE